jgi:hypothetical protein
MDTPRKKRHDECGNCVVVVKVGVVLDETQLLYEL